LALVVKLNCSDLPFSRNRQKLGVAVKRQQLVAHAGDPDPTALLGFAQHPVVRFEPALMNDRRDLLNLPAQESPSGGGE
jgi:hypothetical protein